MATLQESLDASAAIRSSSYSLERQSAHRHKLFQSWLDIATKNDYDLESNIVGKQTLDIGCGQGDMIELFAAILQAQGNTASRVTGVDPANLDYGTPWTLGEAQSGLSAGPLGMYLSFKQSTAPALVASQPSGTYTTAYFVHSLYYFPSFTTIVQTFQALLDAGVKTLLLAEWALSVSQPAALPHLLAVLLQSLNPAPEGNVRTVLSPAAYIDAATEAGWEIVGSRTLTPVAGLEDGKWETGFARKMGKQAVRGSSEGSSESIHLERLRAHADALEASLDSEAGVDGVHCMDVWTAAFRPARPANSP